MCNNPDGHPDTNIITIKIFMAARDLTGGGAGTAQALAEKSISTAQEQEIASPNEMEGQAPARTQLGEGHRGLPGTRWECFGGLM